MTDDRLTYAKNARDATRTRRKNSAKKHPTAEKKKDLNFLRLFLRFSPLFANHI